MERTEYAFGFKILHWLLFTMLAIQFCIAFSFNLFSDGTAGKTWLIGAHTTVGILILVAGALFLLSRRAGSQASNRSQPEWQRRLSRVVQWSLYALLIVQPLLGIVTTMVGGHAVSFFGVVEIPQLFPSSKAVAGVLFEAHAVVAWVFLGLIGLHTLAALYHYRFLRDNVMQRMVPRRR